MQHQMQQAEQQLSYGTIIMGSVLLKLSQHGSCHSRCCSRYGSTEDCSSSHPPNNPIYASSPFSHPAPGSFNISAAGLCSPLASAQSQRERAQCTEPLFSQTPLFTASAPLLLGPLPHVRCPGVYSFHACLLSAATQCRRPASAGKVRARDAIGLEQAALDEDAAHVCQRHTQTVGQRGGCQRKLPACGGEHRQVLESYCVGSCSAVQQERCQAKQQAAEHAGCSKQLFAQPSLTCSAVVHPC